MGVSKSHAALDTSFVQTRTVECLNCGEARETAAGAHGDDAGECHLCGYLGWIDRASLPDTLLRALRERVADNTVAATP
jgi:hypothetical protein